MTRPDASETSGASGSAQAQSAKKKFPTTELGYCLVTGGAGYLGRNLTQELLRRGLKVRVVDRAPISYSHENLDFLQGDLTRPEDALKACQGVDTVFHTAAVLCFYTYATKAQRDASFAVNVGGTENIVAAAKQSGVKRLIYTSSNNVTLDGPVINGDETTPYALGAKDLYTMTKIRGEQLVLAANGHGDLLTAAVRPGGIYGVGEAMVLPRVVEEVASGKLVVLIGDGSAMSDNTIIENLVDGHIEVSRHLVPGTPVCGQAYYITDGANLNYFEFFRPIIEGLGYPFPTMKIPAWPLAIVVHVWEFLHWAIKLPPPFLTILELKKITVSHYNRIDKAKRDFGWTPPLSMAEAYKRIVPYCREIYANREVVDRPHWGWWVSIITGMLSLAVLAFEPVASSFWNQHVPWVSHRILQIVFIWAALVHVYKGMKAARLAEAAGFSKTSMAWGWQTFILGFASLGLLEKRIAAKKKK